MVVYITVIPCTGMQCIKTQIIGNRCSTKHTFWPFLDYGFNAGLNAANFFIRYFFLDLINIQWIFILFITISILNAAFKPKFSILDAALKP